MRPNGGFTLIWSRFTLTVALFGLGACAVRTVPVVSEPEAAQLFAAAAADVERLGAGSNEARFDALTALLEERGLAFAVETFTIEPRKGESRSEGRNVVVTLPGRDEDIVIGAHYDTVRLKDGAYSRGAVDNAASVVVLVRVAEALSKSRPGNRIRIVFFDMEEFGLVGSARYVRDHGDRATFAMVNLDVNAFGDAVIFGPRADSNGRLFQAMRLACAETSRACVEFPRMPPSDDLSFQKAGIATLSVATMPHLQAHQLWLVMNGGKESGLAQGFRPEVLRTIHTPADTSSLVQPAAMAQVYRTILNLLWRLGR